ncbi:hypothetical protein SAMN05892877_10588 [Rhizobium subbaraonis]|uniref:Extensin-like C-terminal domain-containing protein n=1 Tax=Rhizobium subbaraonis TaxID=908946 RepID=A0A285UA83_9HYPH|nr:extensin family protein [Rhizobium subbaraonis]SOC38338.1 hypothetical protein SAMN05892877_10588 [Rhizobium subbaraonis]
MSIASAFSSGLPAALSAMLLLAGCSDGLTPPASIDGESTVNAIRPTGEQRTRHAAGNAAAAYPATGMPVTSAGNSGVVMDDAYGELQAQPAGALPKIDSDEAMGVTAPQATSGTMQVPQDGVNMDAGLGVLPVQGLAEAQAEEIAEGNATQVVVDGIGTDEPRQLGEPATTPEPMTMPMTDASAELGGSAPAAARAAPSAQQDKVAYIPRFNNPMSVPETLGGMPAAEKSCRQRLQRLGVKFRDLPRIGKGNSCGIAYPIELQGLSGGIQIKPAAQVNCQITEAFARWVKNELAPAARLRYLSGVKSIHQMSSYSCRTMNSRRGAAMSEHAKGNAIDVGKIVLNSGKAILVRNKSFFAFREKGLLKAVRSDSCKYFTTVLGPGSDRFHKDHFHFDLRMRKSGYRHCSL